MVDRDGRFEILDCRTCRAEQAKPNRRTEEKINLTIRCDVGYTYLHERTNGRTGQAHQEGDGANQRGGLKAGSCNDPTIDAKGNGTPGTERTAGSHSATDRERQQ